MTNKTTVKGYFKYKDSYINICYKEPDPHYQPKFTLKKLVLHRYVIKKSETASTIIKYTELEKDDCIIIHINKFSNYVMFHEDNRVYFGPCDDEDCIYWFVEKSPEDQRNFNLYTLIDKIYYYVYFKNQDLIIDTERPEEYLFSFDPLPKKKEIGETHKIIEESKELFNKDIWKIFLNSYGIQMIILLFILFLVFWFSFGRKKNIKPKEDLDNSFLREIGDEL